MRLISFADSIEDQPEILPEQSNEAGSNAPASLDSMVSAT